MIREYILLAEQPTVPDHEFGRVHCQTAAQARAKVLILFPKHHFIVKIKKGETFKNISELDKHLTGS